MSSDAQRRKTSHATSAVPALTQSPFSKDVDSGRISEAEFHRSPNIKLKTILLGDGQSQGPGMGIRGAWLSHSLRLCTGPNTGARTTRQPFNHFEKRAQEAQEV